MDTVSHTEAGESKDVVCMDEEGVKDKNPKRLFTEQMREEERMF